MAGFKNGAVAIKKKDTGINADPNFINILVDTSNNLYTIDEFGVYRSIAGYDVVSSGSDISVVTSGGTKVLSLNSTGVVSGTYGTSTTVPQIVIDNKGRILSAFSIPISASGLGTVTSISISSSTLNVINSPITTFGTFGVNLSATGVVSGSILKPFVDSYGRVLSGGMISATDISDRSTDTSLSANSDNKIPTEKAIKTYVDTKRLYVSTGISVEPPPNFVNNNNGTLTIEPTTCRLYSTTDFTGSINEYNIAGTTLALTDGIEQHVCIKYNSGSPIYYVENSDTNINDSDVVCVYIVWRQGLEIHSLGMDSLGLGLGNKTLHAINNTTPYRKSYLGGLVISETATPTPRTILITSGSVFAGVVEQPVLTFNSSVDRLTLAYHNSSVWYYTDTSAYNNTQYDNGTNLVTIPNNKYSVRWFYRSVGDVKQTFYVLGSNNYNNLSDARLELPRTDLPMLLIRHCILVGKSIIEYNAINGVVDTISDVTFSQVIVPNHNDLGNIQGGSLGQYYHVTSAQSSFLSSGPFLALSGGTLSGPLYLSGTDRQLNVSNSSNNTTYGAISVFNNQGVGLSIDQTGSSGKAMNILMEGAGNTSYGIYIAGGSGTSIYASNRISASNFIVHNGTSAGFLKANGSVDSTSYATMTMISALQEPTGFVNKNQTMSFNDSTRTFTISAASGFDIYYRGTVYQKTIDSITISNTSGNHFIYYTSAGTLVESTTPWDISNTVQVALVYWTGTSSFGLCEERHGTVMDWATHMYNHKNNGTRYTSGFSASYTLNSDVSASFGLTNGVISDEDIEINIVNGVIGNYFTQPINLPAFIPVYYRSGVDGIGTWKKDSASSLPYKNNGGTGVNFNQLVTGNWTQTQATNTNFVAYYIYGTDIINEPIISVQGQRQDTSLINAQNNNTFASLVFQDFPVQEAKLLYRIILETKTSYTGNIYRSVIADVTDYRNFSSNLINTGGTGTVTYVGLSANPILSVVGSPIINAGTFVLDFSQQSSGTFLAGPNSGTPSIPSFRTIQFNDLPVSSLSNNYLPLSGGTLTGQLKGTSVSASGNISALNVYIGDNTNANFCTILGGSSQTKGIAIKDNGITRFILDVDSLQTTEFRSYTSAGSLIDNVLQWGNTISASVIANRNWSFGGNVSAALNVYWDGGFLGAYTGGATYSMLYPSNVTPSNTNYMFGYKKDGTISYMNATSDVNFHINDVNVVRITSGLIRVTGEISANGNIKGGSGGNSSLYSWFGGSNVACFGHSNFISSATSFAIAQNQNGATTLNSKLGQNLYLNINDSQICLITSSGMSVTGNVSATQQIQTSTTFKSLIAGNAASIILNSNGNWIGIGTDGTSNDTLKIGNTLGASAWNGNANLLLGGNVSATNFYANGNLVWHSGNDSAVTTYGQFIDHGTIGQYTYVGTLPNNGAAVRESLTVKLFGGHWTDIGGSEVVFNVYSTNIKGSYKQRLNNNSVNWYAYLNGSGYDFYVVVSEDSGFGSFGVESTYYSASGRQIIKNYFQTSSPTGTSAAINFNNYNSGDIRWNSLTNNLTSYGNYYVSNYSGGGTPSLITNTGNARFFTLSLIDNNSTTGGGSLIFTDANIGATGGTYFSNSGKLNAIQLKGSGNPGYGGLYFGENNTEYIGVKGAGSLYLGGSSKVQIDTNQIYFSSTGTGIIASTYDMTLASTNGNFDISVGSNFTTESNNTYINSLSQVSITAHSAMTLTCDSDIYINSTSGTIYTQATQNAKNITNQMTTVTALTAAVPGTSIFQIPDGYNIYTLTQGTTVAYRSYRLPLPSSPKKITLICGPSSSNNYPLVARYGASNLLYNSSGASISSFTVCGAVEMVFDGTDWYVTQVI